MPYQLECNHRVLFFKMGFWLVGHSELLIFYNRRASLFKAKNELFLKNDSLFDTKMDRGFLFFLYKGGGHNHALGIIGSSKFNFIKLYIDPYFNVYSIPLHQFGGI